MDKLSLNFLVLYEIHLLNSSKINSIQYVSKNYRLDCNLYRIYLLSFERSKERSKEKSPAGDKLPEIHSYWRQKFQLTARQKKH